MKKFWRILFSLIVAMAALGAWIFLGAGTGFSTQKKFLYIRSNGATKEAVLDSVKANEIAGNAWAFEFLASRLGYWDKIRPGKYEIKKGASLFSIVRMLRNGQQVPVDLVITKLRTKEDFARFTGARFEFDSLQMIELLNNRDSLKDFEADTVTAMWRVLPDTYRFTWTASPSEVYKKIASEAESFWDAERKQKASGIGLSPVQAYTLASIIEEETTNNSEKDTIASIYLNRLRKGMPLQADPTLKFAIRSFALKRIAGDMLKTVSPYNTYTNKGLPPGPICTPSKLTIDKVLNPAQTPYLYFVANSKLNGHLFSETFEEHVRKANAYREADKLRRQRDSLKRAQ